MAIHKGLWKLNQPLSATKLLIYADLERVDIHIYYITSEWHPLRNGKWNLFRKIIFKTTDINGLAAITGQTTIKNPYHTSNCTIARVKPTLYYCEETIRL